MPVGWNKLFGPRLLGRAGRPGRAHPAWGLRLAARLAADEASATVLEAACRLLMRVGCDLAVVCSPPLGAVPVRVVVGSSRVCPKARLAEVLGATHGPMYELGDVPFWVQRADDPFRPSAMFLRRFELNWSFMLPFHADLGDGATPLVFVAAGRDESMQRRHPLIREMELVWRTLHHTLPGAHGGGTRADDAFWPGSDAWRAAPAALALVAQDEVVAVNDLALALLQGSVGRDGVNWQPWLVGAVRKLSASGQTRQVVPASQVRGRSLELQLGPPLANGRGQLVALNDATVRARDEARVDAEAHAIGHELRTPLTTIKSTLDIVLSGDTGPVAPEQERFLTMCRRNLDRLTRLVDDLLDARRARAGQLRFTRAPVDLGALLRENLTMVQLTCREKDIVLDDAGVPATFTVEVDADKVLQMFHNVISNALKYTPRGGRVEVVLSDLGDAVPGVAGTLTRHLGLAVRVCRLTVTDSGMGMNPQFLAQLFTPFSRDAEVETRRLPGAGLGLHITKGLVEAHDGIVRLASRPGEGTTVRIELPSAPASSPVLVAGRELEALLAMATHMGYEPRLVTLDLRRLASTRPTWEADVALTQARSFLLGLARDAEERRIGDAVSLGDALPLGENTFHVVAPGLGVGLVLDFSRLHAAWQVATCAPECAAILAGTQWDVIPADPRNAEAMDDDHSLLEVVETSPAWCGTNRKPEDERCLTR